MEPRLPPTLEAAESSGQGHPLEQAHSYPDSTGSQTRLYGSVHAECPRRSPGGRNRNHSSSSVALRSVYGYAASAFLYGTPGMRLSNSAICRRALSPYRQRMRGRTVSFAGWRIPPVRRTGNDGHCGALSAPVFPSGRITENRPLRSTGPFMKTGGIIHVNSCHRQNAVMKQDKQLKRAEATRAFTFSAAHPVYIKSRLNMGNTANARVFRRARQPSTGIPMDFKISPMPRRKISRNRPAFFQPGLNAAIRCGGAVSPIRVLSPPAAASRSNLPRSPLPGR